MYSTLDSALDSTFNSTLESTLNPLIGNFQVSRKQIDCAVHNIIPHRVFFVVWGEASTKNTGRVTIQLIETTVAAVSVSCT